MKYRLINLINPLFAFYGKRDIDGISFLLELVDFLCDRFVIFAGLLEYRLIQLST
jgi:hypothetical protein